MSPRRNRPKQAEPGDPAASGSGHGLERTESWRGEEWLVRPAAGSSGRRYRCPGCDQEIPGGTGHVVAWPRYGGVEDRRHWHRACWDARERRGARALRARNAPRH